MAVNIFKPSTWFPKKPIEVSPKQKATMTPIAPTTTAVRSIDIIRTDTSGKPIGGGAITVTGKGAWTSGGGTGITPATQVVAGAITKPTDASYTQGTSVYNPAIASLEENKVFAIKPSPTPSSPAVLSISPYTTYYGEYVEPPPKPIIKEVGGRIIGALRGAFVEGDYTFSSLFKNITIKSDISKQSIPKLPYQTRGTININEPSLTYGEVYSREKILRRGYEPTEIIIQDIAKTIAVPYQIELSKKTGELQTFVSSGVIGLPEAEEQLKEYRIGLERTYQIEFQTKATEYLGARAGLEAINPKKTIDIGRGLQIGTTFAGFAIAPITTASIVSMGGYSEIWNPKSTATGKIFGAIGFIGGGIIATETLGKQITQLGIKNLYAQPTKFKGFEIHRGEEGSYFVAKGIKNVEGFGTITTKVRGPIFPTGEGTYSITGLKGVSKINYFDWNLNKVVESVPIRFGGGGFGTFGTFKSMKGNIIFPEELQFATGRGYIVMKEGKLPLTEFKFWGGSTLQKGYYNIIGGDITKVRLYPTGERTAMGNIFTSKIGYGKFSYGRIKAYEGILGGRDITWTSPLRVYEGDLGRASGGLSFAQQTEQASKQIGFIPSFISQGARQISIPSFKTTLGEKIVFGVTSITSGLKTSVTTEQRQKLIPSLISPQLSELKIKGIFAPPVITTLTTPSERTGFGLVPAITPASALVSEQATKQISQPKLISGLTNIIPPVFTIPTIFTTPTFGFPYFQFPSLGFEERLPARKYKGRQRKKYTPSFGALVFKKFGKMPKGIETGLRTRPITKGFKWSFNIPKFKFSGRF